MNEYTVPAVQYPARELQQEEKEAHHESHHHTATTAPPLPPRHHHDIVSGTGTGVDAGMTMADSIATPGTQSTSIGANAESEGKHHHQHGIHEFGHHHSDAHEHGHHSAIGGSSLRAFDSSSSQHGHDALKNAYHILHGATEMVRGALLGLGDTAGNAIASKTHSDNLGSVETERDTDIIERGKAELQRGLSAFKQ